MSKQNEKKDSAKNAQATQPVQGQQNQQLFLTTQPILEGVLQYLGKQPYLEVAHMIDALKQSKPFTSPSPKSEEKEDK